MGRICDSSGDLAVFANFPSSRRFKIHLRVVSLLSYCVTMGGRGFMKLSSCPDARDPPRECPGQRGPPGIPFPSREPRASSRGQMPRIHAPCSLLIGGPSPGQGASHMSPRRPGLPWSVEAPADAKEKTEAGMVCGIAPNGSSHPLKAPSQSSVLSHR